MKSILLFLITASFCDVGNSEEVLEYGIDMSFAHTDRSAMSTNYPWLPHNVDPENNPLIPDEHVNKTIQVLGDRRQVYDDYLDGCKNYWNKRLGGDRGSELCDSSEQGRFSGNIAQPQSMVVSE